MSVKEIESAVQELANAFNKMDMKAVVNLLSENLEVFDHVPYRFDNNKQFADFLTLALPESRARTSVSASSPAA